MFKNLINSIVLALTLQFTPVIYGSDSDYCVEIQGEKLCTFDDVSSCIKTADRLGGRCSINNKAKFKKKSTFNTGFGSEYAIEKSINDEKFIINGELFEATTYCFGFHEGDSVRFIKGSAHGACVSAKIIHLSSGKTCDLWCE